MLYVLDCRFRFGRFVRNWCYCFFLRRESKVDLSHVKIRLDDVLVSVSIWMGRSFAILKLLADDFLFLVPLDVEDTYIFLATESTECLSNVATWLDIVGQSVFISVEKSFSILKVLTDGLLCFFVLLTCAEKWVGLSLIAPLLFLPNWTNLLSAYIVKSTPLLYIRFIYRS